MDLQNELPEIAGWMKEIGCAVTICDKEGVVLYMNERARATFASHGELVGTNLMDCHSERSKQLIRHMLATGDTNTYTVKKRGITKLIYQTPWCRNGDIAGMVEISIPLPDSMHHYDRDAEEKNLLDDKIKNCGENGR